MDPTFTGKSYHIIDSFEGLSAPSDRDALPASYEGMFNSSVESVVSILEEFPDISYHEGWIPKVFSDLPNQQYRFVHIDVDLVEPTIASFEYFYPRLISGGVIVCDDYGSISWPGTKKAVDKFCRKNNAKVLRLSSGQLILIK